MNIHELNHFSSLVFFSLQCIIVTHCTYYFMLYTLFLSQDILFNTSKMHVELEYLHLYDVHNNGMRSRIFAFFFKSRFLCPSLFAFIRMFVPCFWIQGVALDEVIFCCPCNDFRYFQPNHDTSSFIVLKERYVVKRRMFLICFFFICPSK